MRFHLLAVDEMKVARTATACPRGDSTSRLRVLERRILNLIIEVAALVVADEVGADVFIAGTLGRLGLVLEATEKGLRNILLEVDARVLINDLLSQILRKVLITDAEHIESYTV